MYSRKDSADGVMVVIAPESEVQANRVGVVCGAISRPHA